MPCPAGLSRAQQEGACVSLQESVWGAPTLARLEAIKAKVDAAKAAEGSSAPVRSQPPQHGSFRPAP